MELTRRVVIADRAKKQLRKAPQQLADKLDLWTHMVEGVGLEEVRKIPGFHDEPLKGDRKGQRSIRLSRLWRAIYEIGKDGSMTFVSVEEVIRHTY